MRRFHGLLCVDVGVLHVSPPGLHPKYDFETFLGGILLVQKKHFKLLNGMSNRFWGWGLEDDEFRARIVDANLTISKPKVKTIPNFEDGPASPVLYALTCCFCPRTSVPVVREHSDTFTQRRRGNVTCASATIREMSLAGGTARLG